MLANIAFSIAFLATLTSGTLTGLRKAAVGECAKTFNIHGDQIKSAFNTNAVSKTENEKCFVECVMEKNGVIVNGVVDLDRAKEQNIEKFKGDPEIIKIADEIIEKCSKEVAKPAEKCGYGIRLSACANKYGKEMGLPAPK